MSPQVYEGGFVAQKAKFVAITPSVGAMKLGEHGIPRSIASPPTERRGSGSSMAPTSVAKVKKHNLHGIGPLLACCLFADPKSSFSRKVCNSIPKVYRL